MAMFGTSGAAETALSQKALDVFPFHLKKSIYYPPAASYGCIIIYL